MLWGRLRLVPSRFGPRETAWDLYGPRLDSDWRKSEIKSWVQLRHLALMNSHGRSVARSIAKGRRRVTGAGGGSMNVKRLADPILAATTR